MKIIKYIAMIVLAVGLSSTAFAQQPAPGPGRSGGDQVDRLDKLVNLSDSQKQDIRQLIQNAQATIMKLRVKARGIQEELIGEIKPKFDEKKIRENSAKLGTINGKITAETALLQARIQKALSPEQRATLEKKAKARQKKMQEMRQRLQQQQQQKSQSGDK